MNFSGEASLSLWPCIRSIRCVTWNPPCMISRIGGAFILLISIICLKFNIRFLHADRRQNSLVISLVLASLLVTSASVPGVLVQLFTCHRHCFKIYCRIEGFISYLSGCLCMVILMALSIHRYLSICSYNSFLSYRRLTCVSWLVSLAFTFPLTLNYLSSYSPEGLGFHCSINWRDNSNISRLYILSSFIFMYFLPLAVLLFVNLRAHSIIRNLYSTHQLNRIYSQNMNQRQPMKKLRRTDDFGTYYGHRYCLRKVSDKKCLRMDYRFLRAIIFIVSSYVVAWTPYSIIAVLQLLSIKFIFENPYIVTISAFIAKISVVVTPLVYLSIMNYKSLKKLLWK